MVRIVPANDSPKNLEHRLDLDGSVHDRVSAFSKCAAQSPRRAAKRRRSWSDDHGRRRGIHSSEELEHTLSRGAVRGTIQGNSKVDDRDVNPLNLNQGGCLIGGVRPETIDPDGLQESWQLFSEILTFPATVTQQQGQSIRLGRCGRYIGHHLNRGNHRAQLDLKKEPPRYPLKPEKGTSVRNEVSGTIVSVKDAAILAHDGLRIDL